MCYAQIAGAAVQGGSSISQIESDAATARSNADRLDIRATDALARGGQEESKQRGITALMLGMQRAQQGNSGAVVGAGSFEDVARQTARVGEEEALTIRTNAEREAWGFKSEAAELRAQAEDAQMGWRNLLMPGGQKAWRSLVPTGGLPNPSTLKEFRSSRLPWR